MSRALCITVRFHDARYHGAGDWPPAPARLFQALVAAAALPGLDDAKRVALSWLEKLDPPTIAAPTVHAGQNVNLFVPNNDLDAKGGDIRRIAEVRSAIKRSRPHLFDVAVPLHYVWRFDDDGSMATCLCGIAAGLYQLGRGVDMAWAVGEVLDLEEAGQLLTDYRGAIYRPSSGGESKALDCPEEGSLVSLEERHAANARRFTRSDGKTQFANAPRPRFRAVTYNSPAIYVLFELRRTTAPGAPFAPWPLKGAAALVQALRDGACARLGQHFSRSGVVQKVLIGRDATEADKALRIRIVPLPSIGHPHADRGIRRALVEIPPDCPMRPDDVTWGFAGLEVTTPVIDDETGEILSSPVELVRADDESMLTHYGLGEDGASLLWRSVTPLALREPTVHAVMQALRHAGVRAEVANVRVQREPFEAGGERAEAFAAGTRFSKDRLWHVEIEFVEASSGPLALGNGRYAGLGLMAPSEGPAATSGIHAFSVSNGVAADLPVELARALRRVVMARVRDALGLAPDAGLNRFFSGHERDGAKAAADAPRHLAYQWDAPRQRLLLIAPHRLERRGAHRDEREHLQTLTRALDGFTQLRAGAAGCLMLRRMACSAGDPLLASARNWISLTPYVVTRHRRCRSAREALVADVIAECERYRLPRPEVSVLDIEAVPGHGLQGRVRLDFTVAVAGPIALGRSARLGGGLFCAQQQPDNLPDGSQDGLESRDSRLAPTAAGRTVGAPPRARGGADLAEHGLRARDGGSGLAEGPARSATQPDGATRHFDTAQGRLSYSELAQRLAGPLLRIDDRIRRGEFAERPMEADLLLVFHAALCADLFPDQAGRYRTTAVQVGAHEPPPPHQVAARVLEYTRNLDARLQHLSAEPDERWLETLAYAEGELLSIHPFPDLNGRVSRLWLSELLRRMGLPPVDIVPSDADFRQRYLNALASADRRDWQPLQALWQDRLERAGEQLGAAGADDG